MKYIRLTIAATLFLWACNDTTDTKTDSGNHPRDVNQAISDSAKMENDSLELPAGILTPSNRPNK